MPGDPPGSGTVDSSGLLNRHAAVLTGIAVLAVMLLAITPWPVGVFYDDGIYLILAKSLASGEGYRYLNLPGAPSATRYPPAWPAVLAVLWKISPRFPDNVDLFKAANGVCLALAAAGLVHYGRARLGLAAWVSVAAVCAFTLAIPVVATATVLFSEPLFLALLAPALLVGERAVERPGRRVLLLAALLAGLLTLVRTIGVALIVAVVLGLVFRRRYSAAAVFAAAAGLVLLPWQLFISANGGDLAPVLWGNYGSYAAWSAEAIRERGIGFPLAVVARNGAELLRPMRPLFGGPWPLLQPVLALPLLVSVIAGIAAARTRAPVLLGFLAVYLLIVLAWPYPPDRFLWGIWPVFGLLIAAGLTHLRQLLVRARGRREPGGAFGGRRLAVSGALAIVPLLGYAHYNAIGWSRGWWQTAQRNVAQAMLPLIGWTRGNVAIGEVIAADGDPLLHLYTGRLAVPSLTWTAADYVRPRDPARETSDLRVLLGTFRPRFLLLSGSRSPAAPAALALAESRPPALVLSAVLPGGAAIFTTDTR